MAKLKIHGHHNNCAHRAKLLLILNNMLCAILYTFFIIFFVALNLINSFSSNTDIQKNVWYNSNYSSQIPNQDCDDLCAQNLAKIPISNINNTNSIQSLGHNNKPKHQPKDSAPSDILIKTGGFVMLNAISWEPDSLQNLPLSNISEATYFVLPVNVNGDFIDQAPDVETRFIADVHNAGKIATFAVGGGDQDVAHISSAITVNKDVLIQNIKMRIQEFGYDGVALDIENTNLPPQAIPTFINQLRKEIGPEPQIGVFVQYWQIDTVNQRLQQAINSITWVAPMIYDFEYSLDELKALVLEWLPRVGWDMSKLLVGVAVNYETGLSPEQYKDVLNWINERKLGGVAIWQNTLFTKPWIDAQQEVWSK